MSNEEIVALVKAYKYGEGEHLSQLQQEALDGLLKEFKAYFRSLANNKYYQAEGISRGDVQEECVVGLMKAIAKYKDKNGDFISFAKLWIRRHMICVVSHVRGSGA